MKILFMRTRSGSIPLLLPAEIEYPPSRKIGIHQPTRQNKGNNNEPSKWKQHGGRFKKINLHG